MWYTIYRDDGLLHMNGFLVKYAAIILKARADINELMGKLVRALRQWANVEAPKENFFASSLRGIVGYVISKPSPQGAALLAYDELTKAFGSADKSKKPTEFDYDGNESNGIYRMLQTP